MDYSLYEPEDFASDESYLRYYFKLHEVDVAFWQQWVRNHPERLDVITNADQLIAFLSLHLDEAEFQHEYERLIKAISAGQKQVEPTPVASIVSPTQKPKKRYNWLLAAAITGLLILSVVYFSSKDDQTVETSGLAQSGKNLRSIVATDAPITIHLEDKSTVTLQPGASLQYPQHFESTKREVYLEGEAFFEVSKNAQSPFFVYYKNIVTHVLGTSFTILPDAKNGKLEVSVRSGRVEVYEHAEVKTANNKKTNGVILTPNQKVVYTEATKQFESSLVDVPLPIPDKEAAATAGNDLKIDDIILTATPVGDILKSLEQSYGIDIEVESEGIEKCRFAGDISTMNLYTKLDIICQSLVGASYEVKGTKILVRGKGCD